MKSTTIRYKNCSHCHNEFLFTRTDQKYCSVSCRSANFAIRKRAGVVKPLMGIKPSILANDITLKAESPKNHFLQDVGSSAIPLAINEIIKSLRKINNKDIMKRLEELELGQIKLSTQLNHMTILMEEMNEQLKQGKHKDAAAHFYLGN